MPQTIMNDTSLERNFQFLDACVLRTPMQPFRAVDDLDSFHNDPRFKEAVYLSSPLLYEEYRKKVNPGQPADSKEAEKIKSSLLKYHTRMSTRCTPFGLFSGCNMIKWSADAQGIVLDSGRINRHTRFDMHYLCALAQQFSLLPYIKPYLLFYPNNSRYTIGDEIRYVEYHYINGKRNHQITSVAASEYVQKILTEAGNGLFPSQIAALLVSEDIEETEALSFVDELVTSQLLVSELEPAITGPEFFQQLLTILKRINSQYPSAELSALLDLFSTINGLLNDLDKDQSNDPVKYRNLQLLVEKLDVYFEENRLFQIDAIRVPIQDALPNKLQEQLKEALAVLNKWSVYSQSANLRSFANRFYERYEDREMPLLEVLDNEAGIPYSENENGNVLPLIEGVLPGSKKETDGSVKWGAFDNFLNNKVNTAYRDHAYRIEIKDDELLTFRNDSWSDLSPSLGVMFRLIDEDGKNIFLEYASGTSGANLLGRFAHADPDICEMVRTITAREQEIDPSVIYAEIVHLPESRTGNVLLHPEFRQYEIPYLAKPSVNKDFCIDPSDLMVSVRSGKIYLRSRTLNKIIIPRLSTAHNYSHNTLPVYRFLCDLQSQDIRHGLSFQWGSLVYRFPFLPRVEYKNVILSPASWRFSKREYQVLLDASEKELMNVINVFREKWQLPQRIVLADSDNELYVDLSDVRFVKVWIEAISKRGGIEIKEFLRPDTKAVTDEKGRTYCNQVLAILQKKQASYTSLVPGKINTSQKAQRKFSLGSEWLYYKLYCGVKSSDKILDEVVRPAVEELQERNLIDKFFFIRYYDPSFHLRVRFLAKDKKNIGAIIETLHRYIQPFEREYIWKCQADTYSRELERYGAASIGIAESLFYHDSLSVLRFLQSTSGDEREELRWQFAIRAIDEWLDAFEYDQEQKLSLLNELKNSFLQEFDADKILKTQLNNKYRMNRKTMEFLLDRKNDVQNSAKPLLDALQEKQENIRPFARQLLEMQGDGQLELPVSRLMSSYIHMLVNRIVLANPRLHELVIYDSLYQYYFSLRARKNQAVKKDQP